MTRAEWCVCVFRERLVQREDCFALQKGDGNYALVKSTLTDGVILSHLRGEQTIGLFPYPNGITKWLCIDIDILQSAAVESVHEKLREFSIPYLTEFSGRKGFHIWVFFDRAYPNSSARVLGKILTDHHEVFPKQETITEGCYGNLIKAPLGKHQVTGRWCLFVDEDLTQLEKPYHVLAEVKTFNPETLLSVDQSLNTRSSVQESHSEKCDMELPPLIKDCVQATFRTGCNKGVRNVTAHILATELRNAGVPLGQSTYLLGSVWNPRNHPPLSGKEIEGVVRSTFHQMPLQYGCRPEGRLRQVIQCLGSEQCVFYTLRRSNNPSKEMKT